MQDWNLSVKWQEVISQPYGVHSTSGETVLPGTTDLLKQTCIWGLNQLEISEQNLCCVSCPWRSGLYAWLTTPHIWTFWWEILRKQNRLGYGIVSLPTLTHLPMPSLSLAQREKFIKLVKGPDTPTIMRNQLGKKLPLSKVMPHGALYISDTALH